MKYIIKPKQRYGRLVVVEEAPRKKGYRRWKCRCDCGKFTEVYPQQLYGGKTLSCGCLGKEHRLQANTKHGNNCRGKKSGEYNSWWEMIQRCTRKKHVSYKNYGGRGISVCQRWLESFESFLVDMGPKPTARHWIDRIKTEGNYEPGNCKWSTPKEQLRNTRRNRIVMYLGQRMCLSELAEKSGISYEKLRWRLRTMTPEDAVKKG